MDVDTRLLRYFVAVAEELNFTRAAAQLHLSQPSISKQINQLERGLGTQLFLRTSRSVTLTPVGETLLEQARTVLASWDAAALAVRDAAARNQAVLRVGFIASAANELTPQIISTFARRRPGWRVEMRQSGWEDPSAGLTGDTVDVAILRLPLPDNHQLAHHTLFSEPRWVALPSGHPLANRQRIAIDELYDEPFVATPPEAGEWRDYWLATDERNGHAVTIGAVARTPDEWLEAITNGFGISFTPEATVRFYARPGITYRPVDGITPSQVAVAWKPDNVTSATQDFVSVCQEIASSGRRYSDATDDSATEPS